MTSDTLIKILLVAYVVIMGSCLYEHRWVMALYWGSACLLNFAVLLMGAGK